MVSCQTARPLVFANSGSTDRPWLEYRFRARDHSRSGELDEGGRWYLADLLQTGSVSPIERVAMGNALAHLGDPRFCADAWHLPAEPLLGFVEIPAGPFCMGSNPTHALEASSEEQPQHRVYLPRYYMARYPVTVAQFRMFVALSGHRPTNSRSLEGVPNHPVVSVSWYDALAYCTWLTDCLRRWSQTPAPLAEMLQQPEGCITLPSEAEWEKSARGSDARLYPWGDMPSPNHANYHDTDIHATSPVGCFPDGASPYGVEELSGNVWEWTRNLHTTAWGKPTFTYPYSRDDGRETLTATTDLFRVLRGGAFPLAHRNMRCAERFGYYPSLCHHLVGFRTIVGFVSGRRQ